MSFTRSTTMSRKTHRNRLSLESLESRENPATLTISGDVPGFSVNDNIGLSTGMDAFNRDLIVVTRAGQLPQSYLAAGINRIVVDALTGNDVISVERVLPYTPVVVLPGSGANTVN